MCENPTWCGKPIDNLTRGELNEALTALQNQSHKMDRATPKGEFAKLVQRVMVERLGVLSGH